MPNKATTQEMVLKEIRKLLATGKLKPGQQIIQDALANRFGVSRVPLREALKVLQAEGQVTHEPNRGYFVAELNYEDLVAIYRLRTILEEEAIRVGIPKATNKQIDHIAKLAKDVDKASTSQEAHAVALANRKFHLAILNLCGEEYLMRMITNCWDFTDNYRILYLSDAKNRSFVSKEHARIMTAIRAKDVAKVVKLHNEHRDHAVAALRQLIP